MDYLWWCLVAVLTLVVVVRRVDGTLYTVGGTSGWDVSTDVDSWAQDKTFVVGDSLWFQFSSYESVAELTRKDFSNCNTGNPIMMNKSGNVTVPLTTPGDWFFASGNSMYCLSGLKLQVHVNPNPNMTASTPLVAPARGPTLLPPSTSSKNNNPLSTSSGIRLFSDGGHPPILWLLIGFYLMCLELA
ncbi:hypothetical protein V2J09_016807 [Rumex salicifolius]